MISKRWFCFEGVKRSVFNGALRHSLRIFNQNNWFLRNCGTLKITLLQCYEVLWIHNIDAICSSIKTPDFKHFSNAGVNLCLLESRKCIQILYKYPIWLIEKKANGKLYKHLSRYSLADSYISYRFNQNKPSGA